MTDRQQQVTRRARRAPTATPARARAPKRATSSKRRLPDVARMLRIACIVAVALTPLVGYYVAVGSEVFALRSVEFDGASETQVARFEQLVRGVAGDRLLDVDLDLVRTTLERERAVRTASVTRVLPDTLRVTIEEREPAVVVRLESGRMLWVDDEAQVIGDFKPEDGVIPPPLYGYEGDDRSDRAVAENRDRIARYRDVHTTLEAELWDRLDEVDIRLLQDVKVRLADGGIVVRLGDRDYRERLETALSLLDAVRDGDVETLTRYHVADIERLLASVDRINAIDVSRSNGSVTISYLRQDSR